MAFIYPGLGEVVREPSLFRAHDDFEDARTDGLTGECDPHGLRDLPSLRVKAAATSWKACSRAASSKPVQLFQDWITS